ncbi:MAG: hypothetical protein LAT84_02520 [Balneolia bacterium]|nr:hypothetical protein [Balneolia bacterium]
MNLKLAYVLQLIIFTALALTGEIKYPDFSKMTVDEVSEVSGWTIIKQASGHLSSDDSEDMVVILQSGDHRFVNCDESAELLKDEKRIILVLTAGEREPKVSIQNNRFIAPPISGGMECYLEPDISIENGQLWISYQYVRANSTYTFEFIDESLVLVSAKKAGVSGSVFSSNHFDFLSGVVTTEKGSISSDSATIETISVECDGFKKLSDMTERHGWELADFKTHGSFLHCQR